MKTTALMLGIMGLLACSSCRCDFDEDEAENKYDRKKTAVNSNASRQDTLLIK